MHKQAGAASPYSVQDRLWASTWKSQCSPVQKAAKATCCGQSNPAGRREATYLICWRQCSPSVVPTAFIPWLDCIDKHLGWITQPLLLCRHWLTASERFSSYGTGYNCCAFFSSIFLYLFTSSFFSSLFVDSIICHLAEKVMSYHAAESCYEIIITAANSCYILALAVFKLFRSALLVE